MDKNQIAEKLTINNAAFISFIASLSEADFMANPPQKWTAGQQLEHIVRATTPILLAFKVPKFALRLIFGKPNRTPRTYEELVQKYKDKLAAGAKASGPYIPPATVAFERRAALSKKLMDTVQKINAAMAQYSEAELDTYLLPHPILGKLTMREMMFFTAYHVEHHDYFTRLNLGQTKGA